MRLCTWIQELGMDQLESTTTETDRSRRRAQDAGVACKLCSLGFKG